MIFKYSILGLCLLLCGRVSTAPAAPGLPSTHRLIADLLESLRVSQSRGSSDWHMREPQETRVKPIPAPPQGPALGSVEEPVAWPYPKAPSSSSNAEFPLLENFLKSNGIQNNVQTNHINSQNSQWNEPQRERTPAPTPPSYQWNMPKPQIATTQSPPPSYIQWGVPQGPIMARPAPISEAHPPLNPAENFNIQHGGQNQPGYQQQQKHFSLETLRQSEPQQASRDKLNVSFIMPPNIRPLSLNFDTGEVQIDFGDAEGKRVPIPEAIMGDSRQYRSKMQLDQIFGTQSINPKGSPQTVSQGNSQGSPQVYTANNGKSVVQDNDDDEYIVVRHDMNKYAYDLPKGMSVGTSPQSLSMSSIGLQSAPAIPTAGAVASAPTQTQQVDSYDVSGQKNLHFTLGRVSG